ncbi:MAG: PilN domain-containing protein [bacterium]
MKTDRDLNATNQLIKVIRGEAYSIPSERDSVHEDAATAGPARHAGLGRWWRMAIALLVLLIVCFTFLSVSFLAGQIKNLEAVRGKLAAMRQQIEAPPEPVSLWEQRAELVERIDSFREFLMGPRPYVSSLLKEISHILPKNCFLNRVHIFIPSYELASHRASLTVEATLVNDTPSYRNADVTPVIKAIEASPLFAQTRIGYQDRSILFNYRTIDFQLDFSLE